ncbi:MAG: methyltransferase domain-containing protein [Candidatus Thermoplasmatota archaeon]|nr:methyltransferase domain-containing protein [Candidatus Thermoplasmatota archaeon]
MAGDILSELYKDLLDEAGRLEYTRRAFGMLPKMNRPDILDIGCGNGEPTLELAKLSNGIVTGIDIDQASLDELDRKARELDSSDRVRTMNMSLRDIDFPDGSFDIIWAEGSIFVIGFEKGLMEWRRLIRPKGFLVVHEMCWLRPDPPHEIRVYWERMYPGICTVEEDVDAVPGCGYRFVGHFPLPDDAWWHLYYKPLEERIRAFRREYRDDPRSLAVLDKQQSEVDLYRKHSKWYGSAFFVMQK